MYKVTINNSLQLDTDIKGEMVSINGQEIPVDLVHLEGNRFHFIYDKKSFSAELIEVDEDRKKMKIRVNTNVYELAIKDQFDELLKNLGLDNLNATKIKEIKAPMPGLVLKILVKEGDSIKKGENLLVLEAMKMENMIKSPSDVTIKKISIKSGDKVEKNQIMLLLD
jgi:biotin carboxyl carrier protein